jgi:hypothetical protein
MRGHSEIDLTPGEGSMKRVAAVSCFALFALLVSGVASAGLFRAYLSANGNDANPCTLQQPCRLLPAALAAVEESGEVWILDSGNFNTTTVIVTQPVTILAVPGALASLLAMNDAVALQINASAITGNVALRNLTIRGFADVTGIGIGMLNGASLRIDHCSLFNLDAAINVTGNVTTTIVDTTIHDAGTGVSIYGPGHALIDRLSIGNTASAIQAVEGARVTVSDSTFSENGVSIGASSTGITGTVVDVAGSTISATAHGQSAFYIAANAGLTARIYVHATTIHADVGFSFANFGGTAQIFSYGDNRLVSYTAATQGGSLTPISGI